MIKRRRKWWTGTEASDVGEYLAAYTRDGYPADRFEQSRCVCGGSVFRLAVDDEEGCAERTCTACGLRAFIGGSEDVADESSLVPTTCPNTHGTFEIVVGFSHREDATVKWITVGIRCTECGVLGCPVEWPIDTTLTAHLYQQV